LLRFLSKALHPHCSSLPDAQAQEPDVTKESLAAALQEARAAAEVAEREYQRLCDFLRAEVEQRDSDAVRASREGERVGPVLWRHFKRLAEQYTRRI